jgi:glyoxylase-like metal-dependent hydrolase (beta-lactamase superfamily II)
MPDPIKQVSVVSTGSVSIRPQHVESTGTPMLWWLLTSRHWTGPLPINSYVIEHRDGLVLFDTGQDRASVLDPDYFPKGFAGHIYRRLARFEIGADETLTARLAGLGHDIADVRTAILSHLHQDHIGGLPELGRAEIVLSQAEWDTLGQPRPELNGLLRTHIDLPGLRWRRLAFDTGRGEGIDPFPASHDLFGDGTLVLLPTPGHTPGSISLLVRRPGRRPLLMVGDLTYDAHLLEHGRVPGVGDRKQLQQATRMIAALRTRLPGLVVLAAHDPGSAALLAAANGADDAAGR